MKNRKNKRKYISELLFEEIQNFLKDRQDITRKELCKTFKIFKYNTLKCEDSRGYGYRIGVSAYSGRDALYTPTRILAYVKQKFKIVSEEDIDFCNI